MTMLIEDRINTLIYIPWYLYTKYIPVRTYRCTVLVRIHTNRFILFLESAALRQCIVLREVLRIKIHVPVGRKSKSSNTARRQQWSFFCWCISLLSRHPTPSYMERVRCERYLSFHGKQWKHSSAVSLLVCWYVDSKRQEKRVVEIRNSGLLKMPSVSWWTVELPCLEGLKFFFLSAHHEIPW